MEMKRVKVATHEELEILQKSVDGIFSAMTALLKKRRRKSKSFVNYMIYLSSAWNPTI